MTININSRLTIHLFCLILTIPFFFKSAKAQTKNPNTLLWEITGKGLSKPSYLFGTINVKDSRAYNFSDSLYIALANSSIFAVETHPDTTIKSMVKFGYSSPKAPKPPKTISNDDEPPKMGDPFKQTLANGYLYGLARTFKKKVYGLDKSANSNQEPEDTSAEEDLDEEELAHQEEDLEVLLSLYAKGNLNDIWGEMQQYYEDDYFTERNNALAKEMMALLQNESSVFASVAVALLPGENGMISLLKKAGYNIRPVGATFTNLAKNYQIDASKMEWFSLKDESDHYSVQFPGKPHQLDKNGRAKLWVYVDPVTATLFRSSSLYTGPLVNMTAVAYADTVLKNYAKDIGYTVVKTSRVEKFGSSLLFAELKKEAQTIRTHMIHVNNTFYTFLTSEHAGTADRKATEIFFNSFQISTPPPIVANQWVDYKNELAAFSVKLPVQPDESTKEQPNPALPESPYVITFYMATDKANLMNYIIRYSDYPAGMQLINKAAVFESLIQEFGQKGQLMGTPIDIKKDGYEGKSVNLTAAGSYLEIQTFIKGNRIYMLLKQNMAAPTKGKKDQFFDSFTFLPNLNNKITPFTLGNVEFLVPAKPLLLKKNSEEIDEEKDGTSMLASTQVYSGVNTATGGLYGIEKNTFSKYYKTQIDTLFKHFEQQLIGEKKLIKKNDFKLGKTSGREFITYDSLANTTRKLKFWFQGNSIYLQTLTSTPEEIESQQANTFFEAKVKADEVLFDFKSAKAQLIAQDLLSKNPETQKLAKGALSFYEFEKADLPHIYPILQQKLTDDTSRRGTRIKLLDLFETINDGKTSSFLKELYQNSKDVDLIQSKVLAVLPYADKNSYDWYLKTLVQAPVFKLDNYWPLFSPLTDSLAFASKNDEQLLKLMQVKEYRPMILSIFSRMANVEEKSTYLPLLQTKKEQISKYALADLDADMIKLSANNYSTSINDYLNLLPKLELSNLTDDYTKKVLTIDSIPHYITEAVATRIDANLPVKPETLSAQLDSLFSRYRIIYAFNEVGKLKEVPLKYRKHDEFAKLLMHNYLADEYNIYASVQLLGTVEAGELTYYAFEFTYDDEGEKKTYVGVCGPFNSKTEELDFENYNTHSNFDLKTKDWITTAKALIKELE